MLHKWCVETQELSFRLTLDFRGVTVNDTHKSLDDISSFVKDGRKIILILIKGNQPKTSKLEGRSLLTIWDFVKESEETWEIYALVVKGERSRTHEHFIEVKTSVTWFLRDYARWTSQQITSPHLGYTIPYWPSPRGKSIQSPTLSNDSERVRDPKGESEGIDPWGSNEGKHGSMCYVRHNLDT